MPEIKRTVVFTGSFARDQEALFSRDEQDRLVVREKASRDRFKEEIIISIDGVKGAFEAMIAGSLNVTVECSPLLGPQLMAAVKDVVAGKPIPKRIVTEESVFPKETAAQVLPTRKY